MHFGFYILCTLNFKQGNHRRYISYCHTVLSKNNMVTYNNTCLFSPQVWGLLQDGDLGWARLGNLARLHVFLVLLLGLMDQPGYILLIWIAEVQKGRFNITNAFQAETICVTFHWQFTWQRLKVKGASGECK